MSELNYNVKDALGVQRFITPIVMITAKGKTIKAQTAATLPLAYLLKSIADSAFQNKTVCTSASAIGAVVNAMPGDTSYTVYMPTKVDDRESEDLTKWTPVLTVSQVDVKNALVIIAEADSLYAPLRAQLDSAALALEKIIKANPVASYDVTQPVYFTSTTGAKTRGGKKTITSLF